MSAGAPMNDQPMNDRPIGVFDSGVGGLTVVRALLDLLPGESILYYGDTARGPYGPRDPAEVRGFASEIAAFLAAEGVKMIVAACNSASSAGLDEVRGGYPEIPVLEVIGPAVRSAVRATRNGRVGVIGTELTIRSGAYERAVAATGAEVRLVSRACPRFVEFVERGETAGPAIIDVARDYLAPLAAEGVDSLILGCTHYPLLTGVLRLVMGSDVMMISSAEETAREAFVDLTRRDLFRPRTEPPVHRFVCSGDAVSFHALGARFLGPEMAKVEEHPLGGQVGGPRGGIPWS